MPDLLLELFSEEIPARMQLRAGEDLRKRVTDGLVEAGLTYASAGVFSTPRRLVLSVEGLLASSPNLREERKGPRVDAPEKAIDGFLRSTGLTREALETRDDKKGQVYFAVIDKPGRPAAEIIAEVVPTVIRSFPWPKSMRWGAGSLRWVRPLQSILCILSDEAGAEVVPFDLDGIQPGNTTRGHRFMAPEPFSVTGFEDYAKRLAAAHVMLEPDARRDKIWHDATTLAFAQGLEVVEDTGLLAEVAGLVEWPVVLMGDIDAAFLDLPPEVLQTSMREHQKFFSVSNPKSGRIEKYITVANRETPDNGALILAGNSKVLTARLSDARFFWDNDLRIAKDGVTPWIGALDSVTFHNKLGSVGARIARIEALSREIAPLVGADPDSAAQAARFAKADLASEMVYEFPELQGIMGRYYAKVAGADDAVAAAVQAHYAPLGPSDDVPTAPVSVAAALADKFDLLMGFWSIGEKPTGSGDPFALRRAALGVIRIVLENELTLSLYKCLTQADGHVLADEDGAARADVESTKADLMAFFLDRLKVYLRGDGVRHDAIDACYQLGGQDDLLSLTQRIRALQAFLGTDDGANLLTGVKRATNILAAEEKKDGIEYSLDPDAKFATEAAETALFAALDTAEPQIDAALKAGDFVAAMGALAGLRAPIDGFFDGVKVNDDNPVVRRNRLCLLNRIRTVSARVAVFGALEG
ncbi:glycine--tRNA ligase subunit beta [Oceanibium sediminis]|uniref:glycine--tRNA ligase subunit beta n=1 Tax=Oceanibium sediminis TaxID=2026339 RepID=UPI000DD3D8EC|nr:glycine--tRNA ligase subunit beta [Oceanibium sediminis]